MERLAFTYSCTARAQDLQDSVNPKYVPQNSDDVEIFQTKQSLLYFAFLTSWFHQKVNSLFSVMSLHMILRTIL